MGQIAINGSIVNTRTKIFAFANDGFGNNAKIKTFIAVLLNDTKECDGL
jgi:hypothetical protein